MANSTMSTIEAEASERLRKIRRSSSGFSTRDSHQANQAAPRMPRVRPATVSGSDQPASGPSWTARTRPPTANADRNDPSVSKRPSCSSRELGTTATVMAKAASASSVGARNTQGQVKLSTTIDELSRPRMPPAPAKPAQTPMARSRSSSGKVEVMTERVTGMIMAAAAPATTRATRSWLTEPEKAAATLARTKTTSPVMRTCLRPHRSPMAPIGSSSAARAIV